MRVGVTNRLFLKAPILEDELVAELWTILGGSHRAIIEHLIGEMASVSSDDTYPATPP